MKTPFKMKYNTSPLKSRLNSPLKQGEGFGHLQDGQMRAMYTSEWDFLKTSKTPTNTKSYYTVPCDGGNCPTPKLDEDPKTPGHQFKNHENWIEVQGVHDEIGSGGGGYMTPKNKKILSENIKKVTFDTHYDLKHRINSNRTYTAQFKNTKGSQVSYADAYKKTGIWEGEGSLPSHLEGTHKKPNILQRIFHKSNFKWKSGGTT